MASAVINQGSATLSLPLTSAGSPVTNGVVLVSIYDPAGARIVTDQSMPHVGAGVYSLVIANGTFTTPGEHTVVFTSSFAGLTESTRLVLYVAQTAATNANAAVITSLVIV